MRTTIVLLFSFFLLTAISAPLCAQNEDAEIARLTSELEQLEKKKSDLEASLEEWKFKKIIHTLEETGIPEWSGDGQIIKHTGIILQYDETHEQARWVTHMITPDVITGTLSRSNDFRVDPAVTTGTAVVDDYWDTGFDRGHLAPSADFRWSAKAMSESYFYSNMAPQRPELNREIMADLENWVRNYVTWKEHSVIIVTGGILKEGLPTTGENKVSIPEEFYKVIYDPTEKQAIGFVLPNGRAEGKLESYALPVDEVEKKAGILFFGDLEESVEQQKDFSKWVPPAESLAGDVEPLKAPLPKGLFNTKQAEYHVNDEITVCGTVVSTRFSTRSGNTYLNLDKQFPNQIFTVTIYKDDRKHFAYKPEEKLKGRKICVTGTVEMYKGVPGITVNKEKQIQMWVDMQK